MKKFMSKIDCSILTDQRWTTMAQEANKQKQQLEELIEQQEAANINLHFDDVQNLDPHWLTNFVVDIGEQDKEPDQAY
jgi:hypothetical protein